MLQPGTYVFTYQVMATMTRLVRRPWWNLFGKDTIESYRTPTFVTYTFDHHDANRVHGLVESPLTKRLMQRLLSSHGEASKFVLMLAQPATSYQAVSDYNLNGETIEPTEVAKRRSYE